MEVNLNVLVVDHDAPERQLVVSILRSFRAQLEAVGEASRAAELIQKRKFDGIFVDGELPKGQGLALVRMIRKSASNRKAPVVFITNQKSTVSLSDAFEAGVTFFLTRPLDQKKVNRLLNATRGAMLSERRGYHRVAVEVLVRFKSGPKKGQGSSVNISRSGILFEAGGALAPGDKVEVEFALPHQSGVVTAQGQVARVDSEGRAGVRFIKLAAADLELLQNFIGI